MVRGVQNSGQNVICNRLCLKPTDIPATVDSFIKFQNSSFAFHGENIRAELFLHTSRSHRSRLAVGCQRQSVAMTSLPARVAIAHSTCSDIDSPIIRTDPSAMST